MVGLWVCSRFWWWRSVGFGGRFHFENGEICGFGSWCWFCEWRGEDAYLFILVIECWYFPHDFWFILDLETWSMIFFFFFILDLYFGWSYIKEYIDFLVGLNFCVRFPRKCRKKQEILINSYNFNLNF